MFAFRSSDPRINEVLRTSSLNPVGMKTLARIHELSVRILVKNSDVTERFANFVTFHTLNPMVFVHITKLCDHVVSDTNDFPPFSSRHVSSQRFHTKWSHFHVALGADKGSTICCRVCGVEDKVVNAPPHVEGSVI